MKLILAIVSLALPLHDYLARMEAFGFSGSVAVTRKGETLFERAYGFADRERQVRNTPATIFDTGSLGKQFTGAAILKLEEAGKLKTSDPISKYLDGVPEDKRAITIHQLLTMTAGLAPAGSTAGTAPTREGRLKQLLGEPLIEPPGTRMEYSNGGYNLLAAIIEKVSGMPYEAFVRRTLFEPAGLKSTAFIYERPLPFDVARVANTYAGGEVTKPGNFPEPLTWFFKGAGGALTTPGDLCRWHRVLVSGNVLSKASLAKYYTPGLGEHGFAYGWGVFPTPHGRLVEMGGGTTNGVGAKLLRFLDSDTCIAMTINNEGEAFNEPVSAALTAMAFGDNVALPPAVKPMPAAELAKLAGTYRAGEAVFEASPAGDALRIAAKDPAALAMLFGAQHAPDLSAKTEPIVRERIAEDFKGRWRPELGGVKGFAHLGTTPEPGGDFASNYRIDFEKGSIWQQYVWFPRGLDGVRVLRTPPSLELRPAGGGAFVAVDLPAQSFVTARLSGETIAFERASMRAVPPQRRGAAPVAAASFPDTKAGTVARRYVDAYNGGEAAVRAFITSEYSAKRLAERSVDDRMGGYQATLSRLGTSLTLVRVMRSTDSELEAVLRGASGQEIVFQFTLDPEAPGKLLSIRLLVTN